MKGILLLLISLGVLHGGYASVNSVKGSESEDQVTLENGYTKVSFSKRFGYISSITSDFSGSSSYSENILSHSFGLEVNSLKNKCLDKIKPIPNVEWIEKSDKLHKVKISNVFSCTLNPVVSETWTISLTNTQRQIDVAIEGKILEDTEVNYIAHSLYLESSSLYALFDRGVAQMMSKKDGCMGSSEQLSRAYFLGNGGALDFIRNADTLDASKSVVLLSQTLSYNSGIQNVLYGSYPNEQLHISTAWNILCWDNTTTTTVTAGDSYSVSYTLIPNNADFPVYLLNDIENTQNSLPTLDIQTYLTGIYASPVGCLQSYYDLQTGIIAPTISHPDIGYDPDTNFFDPDNFLSLSAMLYSNDEYLVNQVRLVLERTAETMCGVGNDTIPLYCNIGRQRMLHKPLDVKQYQKHVLKGNRGDISEDDLVNTRTGQLMHHYVELVPTYESIAGSEQLGPNVFWTKTALKYMASTQDSAWAVQMFDNIFLSTKFLLTFFDPEYDMIYAPGPLWIDVIVRENYSSDSNAIMVPVLLELADYFDYIAALPAEQTASISVVIESDFTTLLRDVSARISTAINANLWDATSGDHYITQLNPDSTTRDFVDYDSNLLTVAYGIAPADRTAALIARVDSGDYTHVRATWCSEIPYTGDADDCYIVGGDVCGDSVVTLARIGWVDAMARKAINDLDTFNNLLLLPLQNDLVADTWLYERYDETGTQIRTSFYFEYPSLVTMLLHDIRYGISMGLQTLTIDPFPAQAFTYSIGNVNIVYGSELVSFKFPGTSATSKKVSVYNLSPSSTYEIASSCSSIVSTAVSDASGLLSFDISFVDGCTISATKK